MELVEGLGYKASDILVELRPKRYRQFLDWMKGQTMAVSSKGEGLVYPCDYEAFLRGDRVYD